VQIGFATLFCLGLLVGWALWPLRELTRRWLPNWHVADCRLPTPPGEPTPPREPTPPEDSSGL